MKYFVLATFNYLPADPHMSDWQITWTGDEVRTCLQARQILLDAWYECDRQNPESFRVVVETDDITRLYHVVKPRGSIREMLEAMEKII
ncbi:MAG: hypothetical protein KGJ90_06190 [Patescibacteria group bacterium]|nr:hypothetical protein [Patescibacteria group bacterium]